MSEFFGTSDYHFNKINETTGQLEEYVHSLLADREAIVRYVKALRMDSGDLGMHTQALRKKTNEAYQVLSQELRDLINDA